jgi:hypothetical protein
MSINKRIKTFKSIFIKKFFPNIRIFSDDLIHNILTYFERIQYQKYDKIFSKGNYNEYIYLIISGEVSYCLKPKSFFIQNCEEYDYILLEKLGRGDLIGINSALNSVKNEYYCLVISTSTELYRISKGDFLYYFGGLISDTALNLKAIGDLQDMAISKKIEYLKNNNFFENEKNVNDFCLKIPEKEKERYYNKGCLIIYEDPIDNILFEKWKSVKIGLSDFKNKLIGQKKKRIDEGKKNNFDIHEKDIDIDNIKNRKDIGMIKKEQSYSLYRVANGRLNLKLNNSQMKSLNKLNKFCDIKTNDKNQKDGKNKGDNIRNKYNDKDKDNKSNIKLDDEENNI